MTKTIAVPLLLAGVAVTFEDETNVPQSAVVRGVVLDGVAVVLEDGSERTVPFEKVQLQGLPAPRSRPGRPSIVRTNFPHEIKLLRGIVMRVAESPLHTLAWRLSLIERLDAIVADLETHKKGAAPPLAHALRPRKQERLWGKLAG